MRKNNYSIEDADDANDQAAEVVQPEDFVATTAKAGQPTVAAPSIAELSDEDLAKEIARRRTAKIDQEIATLETKLEQLKNLRTLLLEDAVGAVLPAITSESSVVTPSTPAKSTNINPVTGKIKLKPGSTTPDKCSCGGEGCFVCLRA